VGYGVVRPWYRLRMTLLVHCTTCGTEFDLSPQPYHRRVKWTKFKRAFDTDECLKKWVSKDSGERMARTNRAHASARMKANNPMAREGSREKMKATLAEIGHKPHIRRGNGHPPTQPQQRLADFLGWETEAVIAPKDGERPYHYRMDVAHPAMKVGIEVDGSSHCSLARQASDRRKEERLRSLGWLLFRFSNREAMEHTAECAQMVLSTTSKWRTRTPT
jgi:hypothetical protein